MTEREFERILRDAEAVLSDEERRAFQRWCESDDPSLSATMQPELYEMWLQGRTCREIARVKKVRLGQVVQARLAGEWDRHARVALDESLRRVSQDVLRARSGAVQAIAAVVRANAQILMDAVARYAQTGDAAALGEFHLTPSALIRMVALLGDQRTDLPAPQLAGQPPTEDQGEEQQPKAVQVVTSAVVQMLADQSRQAESAKKKN